MAPRTIRTTVGDNGDGLGVDRAGNPVRDPTKNVLDLVEAAINRIDDLMESRDLRIQEKFDAQTQLMGVHSKHNAQLIELHSKFQGQLDVKESSRLDSVRTVDQLAVRTEGERSQAAIVALATQAATTAETLRNAVNTSASNLATQLDRTVTALIERISSLEKSSYTGAGRAGVADPQVERLSALVEQLARNQSNAGGKSEGISTSWAVMVAAAMLALGIFAAFSSNKAEKQLEVIYAQPAQQQMTPSLTVQPSMQVPVR